MPEVGEKIDRLEFLMAQSQLMYQGLVVEMREFKRESRQETKEFKSEMKDFKSHTQSTIDNLSKEMKEFKDEMKEFKDEMKQDRIEMKQDRIEMKQDRIEMKQDRKEMNRKWGDLANKWGTIMEDMVIPNIKIIAEKYFNCNKEDCQRFAIRFEQVNSTDKKKKKEFDIIAVYSDKIIVNETKASPKQDYIDKFIKDIADFYDYFPEYQKWKVIPLFSSLYIPSETVKYLTRNKIYAMAMKEDTMDILNPEVLI
jgi:hypothetical protein